MSIEISSINYKSIDVTITDDYFEKTDVFKITSSTDPSFILLDSDITKVFNKDYSKVSLVFDTATNSKILKLDNDYTLTIERNGSELEKSDFSYTSLIPNSAELVGYGSRFFTLNFPFPVWIDPSDATETPFLLLVDAQSMAEPSNILLSEASGFKWTISPDLKSINIESTKYGLNPGNFSLIINRMSESTNETLLKNYSDDTSSNIFPSTTVYGEIPFFERTEIESIEQIGDNEILVKFSNPVQLLAQDNPSEVGFSATDSSGDPLVVSSVRRPDYNSPNELIYTLDAPLTPDDYTITINPIYDANRNATIQTTETLSVVDTPPNLTSATPVSGDSSKIKVVFSTIMDTTSTTSPTSVTSPNNYTLTGPAGFTGVITSITTDDSSGHTEAILTLDSPLIPGKYTLQAADTITNQFGTAIDSNSAEFEYKEAPKVTDVLVLVNVAPPALDPTNFEDWNSVAVIKYNQPMIVGPTTEFSAQNALNYLVKESADDFYTLNPNNSIIDISNPETSQDRFRIPLTLSGDTAITDIPITNFHISPGYSEFFDAVRVTRKIDGKNGDEVLYPNSGEPITKYATPMKLCEEGSMHLLPDNRTIEYTYDNDDNVNEFYSLTLNNLKFSFDGGPEILSQKAVINPKSIEFTFAEGTFDSNSLSVKITQIVPNSIKDIFGYKVIFNVDPITSAESCEFDLKKDKILPELRSVSLVAIDPSTVENINDVKIALFFNKKMNFTDNNDFVVISNNTNKTVMPSSTILSSNLISEVPSNIPFTKILLPESSDLFIVELNSTVDDIVNSGNAQLLVGTNLDATQISTIDEDKNKIEPIAPLAVSNLKADSFTWEFKPNEDDNTFFDSTFTLKFSTKLNTTWFSELGFDSTDNVYSLTSIPKYYAIDDLTNEVTTLSSNSTFLAKFELKSIDDTKTFGTISIKFYSGNSAELTPDTTTPRDVTLKFSIDNKSIIITILKQNLITFISDKQLESSYFQPEPYMLISNDSSVFVDTSYKANESNPTNNLV